MRHGAMIGLLMLCVGCGDDASSSGGVGGDGGNVGVGGSAGVGGGPAVVGTFEVKWGPTSVPSGQERTQCVVKRIGNEGPIFVNRIHNQLGATSHHFIVYEVNDTEELPEPFDCFPFEGSLGGSKLLMITQKADDILTLPPGVAYELQPGQMVRLELHYINVSAADQMAEATSTFTSVSDEGVEFRADIEFLGPLGFPLIEAGQNSTLGPMFIGVPADLQGVNFFAITGHQHRLGTNVSVEVVDSSLNPVQAVYDVENFSWDEPETVTHDPPFVVPPGGGFNLTCDWFNYTEEDVGFGTSVNAEMCFFWAYYYQ